MSKFSEAIVSFFDRHEISYALSSEDGVFETCIPGENATYQVIIHDDCDHDLIRLIVLIPLIVPEGARSTIGELLHRVNNLVLPFSGVYHLSYDTGRCRVSVTNLVHEGLSDIILKSMLTSGIQLADFFYPALGSVIYANESAEEALRHTLSI